MTVCFRLIGGSEKRWHGKVARAAADRLSACVQAIGADFSGLLAAEFHSGTPESVEIRNDAEQQVSTIVFSTAHWGSMSASIEDAVEQLASAMIAIAPRNVSDSLATVFGGLKIRHDRRVRLTGVRARADHRSHIVLQFENSRLSLDEVHRLADELDTALQICGAGEVDGSGCGIGGMHLDLSLSDRRAGLDVVSMFIVERGLGKDVRLVDSPSRREADVSDPNA